MKEMKFAVPMISPFVIMFCIFLVTGGPVYSQQPDLENPRQSIDPSDLEIYVDGLMTAHMREHHIVGAVFTAVQADRIILAKGYGYADLDLRKPVNPKSTLFRPGSVSKLVTWTAVMQLVEQGKIDLDMNINSYLQDFQIPDTFQEPISMAHLMTHTAGFEDFILGLGVRTPEKIESLSEFLSDHMPARVMPPGELAAYSNYGTALAGYVVECVSGKSFEDYAEEYIFRPLGMEHSTFRQPLPEYLAPEMSVGYSFHDGFYHAEDFELINGLAPAGSMSGSAEDMARFMLAHLAVGEEAGETILSSETLDLMHSQIFAHNSMLDGNAHGFWEWTHNDSRTLVHGGDTRLFHSMLVLIPRLRLGFFVSYNSEGAGGELSMTLMKSILDRYLPHRFLAGMEVISSLGQDLKKYAGIYGITRSSTTTLEKLNRLVLNIKVELGPDSSLLFTQGGETSRWIEVEPLVFRNLNGQSRAIFREDIEGRVTHLFLGDSPWMAGIRLDWHQKPGFHYLLLGGMILIFLSSLAWVPGVIRRRLCRENVPASPGKPYLPRVLAGAMSFMCLIFIVGMFLNLSAPDSLIYGISSQIKILLLLPILSALPALGVLISLPAVWIKRHWTWCIRVHLVLLILNFCLFLWFLDYWNLLGLRI